MNRQKTDLIDKLIDYFDNLPFELEGKNICVCLSGGADSVALLIGLQQVSHKFKFLLSACHFNHMIRGEEADRDEEFCAELCKKNNIKLYRGRDDVPLYAKTYKLSLEDAARKCRYNFFDRIVNKNSVDFCATAHNMNDNAETLLLNLIRGSGSNGASGIAEYNDCILRPFLKITRGEIEDFLNYQQQTYITDSTNFSEDYSRNFLRLKVFPKLRKINPSVEESFSRYIDSCKTDREYFEEIITHKLNCDLRNERKSIRSRVIIKKCKDSTGIHPNHSQISMIDAALFNDHRTIIPLNEKFEVVIENGNIDLYNINTNTGIIYQPQTLFEGLNKVFNDHVEIEVSKCHNVFKNFNNLSTNAQLTSAKIIGSLYVRNRKTGDKILFKGISRSLKKMFIDRKIPKEYRDIIPIICDEMGIIYVPFIGVADRVYSASSADIMLQVKFNSIDQERWGKAYEK